VEKLLIGRTTAFVNNMRMSKVNSQIQPFFCVLFVLIDKNFDYWYLCRTEKIMIMLSSEEKELQVTEYFLKSFEEKSPLDYDILDSMFQESGPITSKLSQK